MLRNETRIRHRECNDKIEKLRNALTAIISHYDEFGARTRGMDLILNDCRKLLEEANNESQRCR